jgi:squalene-associated FAD-dependent desaturase
MSADVIVIGGGLSGLSTAVDLASRGISVLILEQRQHPGGRTYSFVDEKTGSTIDNGQHLMMGCYHETRWLLHTIGSERLAALQPNLHIDFRSPLSGVATLHCPTLPAPLHLLAGMLKLRSLSLLDRLKLLRVGLEIRKRPEKVEPSIASLTVHQWLDSLGQSEANKKYLWNVIAVGSLNEDPSIASALLFYRVLRAAFFGEEKDSSFLIPQVGLSQLFNEPSLSFIRSRKGDIQYQCTADALVLEGSQVMAIRCSDGVTRSAGAFVSAIPWYSISGLLPADEPAVKLAERMQTSPILSINLWFDRVVMDEPFLALLDSNVQWVFNKSRTKDSTEFPGQYLSLVISGARGLIEKNAEELVALALNDLKQVLPRVALARLNHSVLLKEKRATFSPRPEIESIRPSCNTSLKNMFLAGDWTNTGYPATIEGAVMSGRNAAARVSEFLAR